MHNLNVSIQKISGFSVTFLLAAALVLLSGCGGSTQTTATAATASTLTPGGTPVVAAPKLSLALTNAAGGTVTSISSSAQGTVTATLVDANGAVVPNTVVTFTTSATLATMTPTGGTALTNGSGVAQIKLDPASITAAGAATIDAAAQVGTTAVTSSLGFSIGSSTLTLSALSLGAGSTAAAPLSAFGTTSISVSIYSGGVLISSPQVVTFTSTCAGSGKAVLTASATTVNGVAVASYRDNGCAGSDVITASVGTLTTPQTVTIYVAAPAAGSIQYVSSTPTSISLSGTGGVSVSQVKFKVVDGGGNPLTGKNVTFGLSTTVGGISLTPASATATSDGSGFVFINVNAGTISTPVRVTATTCSTDPISPCVGTTLSTQSSQLTITTGIPSQSSFSLSATTLNIEGWLYDGATTVLTARLADHFSNPVPDGTAVNFISEGARVGGSCITLNGDCSVTFNSQNIRPANGRVTVLAYAVGEESFVDLNGNGVADAGELTVNGASTDMGEAYVDYNENGIYDSATEPYVDFNGDGLYSGTTAASSSVGATVTGDGKYNGVLCTTSPVCSPNKTIDVRQSIVIVLSGSNPVISTDIASLTSYNSATNTLNLDPAGGFYGCGGPQTINVRITDLHGNPMPAGTTVTFATNGDGTVQATTGSFPVQNTNVAIAPSAFNYSVTVKGDGSYNSSMGTCTDATISGTLTVTVTTPGFGSIGGSTTKYTIANLQN